MTDQEINIAIAEACGWKLVDFKTTGRNPARSFDHYNTHGNEPIPDYLNDLNAVHEVVAKLNSEQYRQYCNHMSLITGAGGMSTTWQSCRKMIESTARQRAEAFLRTIGKWVEREICSPRG